MWKKQTEEYDWPYHPSAAASLSLTYLSAKANFTCLCLS
jgi:hypothetical protein